jgi:hypothetical protein
VSQTAILRKNGLGLSHFPRDAPLSEPHQSFVNVYFVSAPDSSGSASDGSGSVRIGSCSISVGSGSVRIGSAQPRIFQLRQNCSSSTSVDSARPLKSGRICFKIFIFSVQQLLKLLIFSAEGKEPVNILLFDRLIRLDLLEELFFKCRCSDFFGSGLP